MKRFFTLVLKEYLKTIYLPVLLLAFCVTVPVLELPKLENALSNSYFFLVTGQQRYIIFAFLLLLLTGYELAQKASSSGSTELLSSLKNGPLYHMLSELLVMALLSFVVFAIFFSLAFYCWLSAGVETLAALMNSFKAVSINYFFTGLFAGAAGIFLGKKLKRVAGYAVILVLFFFVSPLCYPFIDTVKGLTGVSLYPLQELFHISSYGIQCFPDQLYGTPAENWRLLRVLFFTAVFVGLLLVACIRIKWRKVTAGAVSGAVSLALLVPVLQPGDVYRYISVGDDLNANPLVRMDDTNFYERNYVSKIVSEENNQITSYDIQLNIGRQLNARVTLRFKEQAEEFHLTLYHTYLVTGVEGPNWISAEAEQDGDFLTVKTEVPVNEITLEYGGSGKLFYANDQAVNLPGYLPWYPIMGHHQLYNLDYGWQFPYLTEEKQFRVTASASMQLYSNLPGEGNTFEGTAAVCTLIGGIVDEKEENGLTKVYLPIAVSLPTSRDSIQSKMDSILEKIGYNGLVQLSDGYKIIQMKDGMGVESSADIYLAWTDHTVIENRFDSEKIAKSVLVSALCKDNEKISLFSAFLDYIISGRSWETALTLTEDGELTDDMIKSLRYGPSLQMELYPAKFALAQRENPEFYKEIVAYVTGDSQEKPMDFLDRISNFNEVIARGAAQ